MEIALELLPRYECGERMDFLWLIAFVRDEWLYLSFYSQTDSQYVHEAEY